jgi:hypothetical protein
MNVVFLYNDAQRPSSRKDRVLPQNDRLYASRRIRRAASPGTGETPAFVAFLMHTIHRLTGDDAQELVDECEPQTLADQPPSSLRQQH